VLVGEGLEWSRVDGVKHGGVHPSGAGHLVGVNRPSRRLRDSFTPMEHSVGQRGLRHLEGVREVQGAKPSSRFLHMI